MKWRSAAAVAALALLAACGGGDEDANTPRDGDTTAAAAADTSGGAAATTPNVPEGPTTELPPNELGRILVLEYHRLGTPEGEWFRTLEHFRQDLQTLYDRGYRPVTMRQVAEGNIDLPRGTTPVVFTIDDASQGQFYLLEDGTVDPATMMGSWMAFRERNPAWNGGAVWCILPAASHPSNFFGERPDREVPREQREQRIRRKMELLVQGGHEACNHTLFHERLSRGRDDAQVQEWIGVGEDSIKAYLPADYDIVTFALPLGIWPLNRQLACEGTYREGKRYENRVVLEVSGGPNVSPFDVQWDPHSVDRFIVAPGALERQLDAWERNPADRYVSDGEPRTVSYPARLGSRLNRNGLGGRTPREIADPAPAAPAAPTAPAPADSGAR